MSLARCRRCVDFLFAAFALFFGLSAAAAETRTLNVVASITPIHGLVAAVMEGAGEPYLLVPGARSPHLYRLKPSDAAALQNADAIFWIGPGLENFLIKPLQSLADTAQEVSLMAAPGLHLLPLRFFTHADHNDHGHSNDEKSDSDVLDPHIWLDPHNAGAMIAAIAATLADLDPTRKPLYQANAVRAQQQLDALRRSIQANLDAVADRRFINFHDAFQYFEQRFGLQAETTITAQPEIALSAKRVQVLRRRLQRGGVACVFAEPQFAGRAISLVTENTDMKVVPLDPLGSFTAPGPTHYFEMMNAVARAFQKCLR